MNFTQEQIVAIVGSKEMELIFLRMENAQLKEQLEALTKQPEANAETV